MKKLQLLFIAMILSGAVIAQAPQSFKYQAVARNTDGAAIVNSPIGLKCSILSGSANGNVVYSETFEPTSNSVGVFAVTIGQGNVLSGNFSDIGWGTGPYFLKTAMDISGGTNYVDMGTTQFLSVPYALYAGSIYVHYANDTLYIGDQYVIISGGGPQPGTVTDYDGNTYETITIGEQTWLKQNLQSLHYADGTPIDSVWVYENNESNAAVWGRLYNWEAAMHGASSSNSNPSGVQGACPDGWHMPSKAEFEELVDFVGAVGGGWKLKETGTQYWNEPNSNTNESGFSARGAGDKEPLYSLFENLMELTQFWTSTQKSTSNAYNLILYRGQGGAPMHDNPKDYGFSVRCVKN